MIRARNLSAVILAAAFLTSAALPSQVAGQGRVNTGDSVFALRVTTMRDMPFRTVVRQQYDYSCGSAALATLLREHYGRPIGEAQVFKAMYAVGDQPKIRKVGFSLLDMKTYLGSIGLSADGYRETLDDLQASDAPGIAVIQIAGYRHFVVVKGVRDGRVLVGDPAQGLRAYATADFAKVWNGVIFKIEGGERVAFNRAEEWAALPHAPRARLYDYSLGALTRELPPIYQITPFRLAAP
ncbi:C39 family peptidase [Phenylobacterium sp.]|uniref:C39 family peptidase n=1 Tax=Phenylobacterium sp. TaxID=1871053 RepID=UPI00356A6965